MRGLLGCLCVELDRERVWVVRAGEGSRSGSYGVMGGPSGLGAFPSAACHRREFFLAGDSLINQRQWGG